MTVISCCCSWGAAVRDEWPEFDCDQCPQHGQAFGDIPQHLCKKHTREGWPRPELPAVDLSQVEQSVERLKVLSGD